jgi:hypothetical protein
MSGTALSCFTSALIGTLPMPAIHEQTRALWWPAVHAIPDRAWSGHLSL